MFLQMPCFTFSRFAAIFLQSSGAGCHMPATLILRQPQHALPQGEGDTAKQTPKPGRESGRLPTVPAEACPRSSFRGSLPPRAHSAPTAHPGAGVLRLKAWRANVRESDSALDAGGTWTACVRDGRRQRDEGRGGRDAETNTDINYRQEATISQT